MPAKVDVYHKAEQWTELLSGRYPESLAHVVLFNDDSLYCQCTEALATLLIIFDTSSKEIAKILESTQIAPSANLYPFVLTTDEAQELCDTHPLDLLHLKTNSSIMYGEDMLKVQEQKDALIRKDVLAELSSIIWYLRSIVPTLKSTQQKVYLQGVLRRSFPALKGALYLLGASIPTQWTQVLSSLEGQCNITTFVLSRSTEILETGKKSTYKKESSLLVEVQEAFEIIIQSLLKG